MVNGMANRETSELGEEGVAFAPKALSLGCSLQYWGSVGS